MQKTSVPIIDTHIHLFDTRRPRGVPWPARNDAILYKPALPSRYRKIAVPRGICGAMVVEASPLLEDNQWVLDIAAKNTLIVGTVGNLEPGKKGFRKYLERFSRNPLFRGIRYGNLWGRSVAEELAKPGFRSDLKFLASGGLELDAIGPDSRLIADAVRLTDKIPSLRLVINHFPQFDPPHQPHALRAYEGHLRELGKRPQAYAKVSALLRRVNGRVPQNLAFYRPRLDELWSIFGENRLIYGSDWPNSDLWAPYPRALQIVRQYFTAKGPLVAEKFFWKNSFAAYRWIQREPHQPNANRT